ncbi:aa3-type cytochrome c oxidase subunit IV [Cribrihabitans sp. XS_ASV171]
MAEYKHGDMDITDQEKTFAGFVKFTTWFVVFLVFLALFLAIFAA